MYYNDDNDNAPEEFTPPRKQLCRENFDIGNSSKFPKWLLIVIVLLALLVLSYFLRKLTPKPTQEFGFRFY